MFKFISYWLWKRRATKNVRAGRVAKCAFCQDPIVPGDYVGIMSSSNDLVHAGFHFSVSQPDAFCEIGAVAVGVWDGVQVVGFGESPATHVIRTGRPFHG